LHGAHAVGKIMMENCPVYIKEKLEKEDKLSNGV